jgi:hypothetical protein
MMSKPKRKAEDHGLTRREFAGAIVLAGAGAQEPKTTPPKPAPSAADALAEVAQLRYGKHLSEEQLKEVRRGIERGLRSAERLRQVKLANSDEPAFVFSAFLP